MPDETSLAPQPALVPTSDCPLCPRLAAFRDGLRAQFPDWHNAPVPAFGNIDARILILGLAPGMRGANRTGRPFTGDYAGDLLYATLLKFGLADGTYAASATDGLRLQGVRISNAARCVPPENKPLPAEIKACRPFLQAELAAMPNLRAAIVLGRTAHDQFLATVGARAASYPFAHARIHELPAGWLLADSYHCSRYNTNTGRLTVEMFETVFRTLLERL